MNHSQPQEPEPTSLWLSQGLPLVLTAGIFAVLSALLFGEMRLLNYLTGSNVVLRVRWVDMVIGVTVYLKTAIDFAMYIGTLMAKHTTWKDRVAIELGSAIGNALGTMAVVVIWALFRQVPWLMFAMIVVAGLVLLRLAEESLEHTVPSDGEAETLAGRIGAVLSRYLAMVNNAIAPFVRFIVPSLSMPDAANERANHTTRWWSLFALAFTIPFVLGLDDFAGYVSLFSVVNIFGFGIGVFFGHMILNIALYLSPRHTIAAVKHRWVALVGSAAFIVIAVWGFWEAAKILIS